MSDQETGTDSAAETTEEQQAQPQAEQQAHQQAHQQASSEDGNTGEAETDPGSKKGRGRKQSTARKTRSVELTLTVTGTAEGEWQAELTHSGKRIVQGLPIAASAVSKAASELHPDISETIESVLTQAREQHEAKLAELEAEVEKVRKTLADLEG